MQLIELVDALLRFDALTARQWVADAEREKFDWHIVARPNALGGEALAVAAGVVEMFASRTGRSPPGWTAVVVTSPRRIFLVKAAEKMTTLRRLCEEEGPLPLRSRLIFAPPEFLNIA